MVIRNTETKTVKVSIRNSGPFAGKQTILLFWRPKNGEKVGSLPIKQKLIAYKGISDIAPGQSATVSFSVQRTHFEVASGSSYEALEFGAHDDMEYELFARDGENERVLASGPVRNGCRLPFLSERPGKTPPC